MDFASYAPTVIFVLSILTVVGQIIAAILFIILIKEVFTKSGQTTISRWVADHALILMFVGALTATLGSLFFSDVALWSPCKDCWFQRIMMYPQVILLAVALWKKDSKIAPYILALSLLGIVISTMHYSEQLMAALQPPTEANPLVPCDASGVSCAKTEIHFTFGYITIPMMALTVFLLNTLGSITLMRKK